MTAGEVEQALLDGAGIERDGDVLVLGPGRLAFDAHDRVGDGWVYVVQAQADELEELFADAHAAGAAGVAYLVGEAPVLPLPDGAVGAAVGRIGVEDGAFRVAASELARVLRAGGRVALAESDAEAAGALGEALAVAGFADVASLGVAGELVVTARRG